MLQPTLQIPLDSVEIPDEKPDSLLLLHNYGKAVHGIVKLVKRKKSKVVVG
jgi:hypothetical protein